MYIIELHLLKSYISCKFYLSYKLGFVSIRRFQIEASRSVLKSISDRGFVSIYHTLFRLRDDCESDVTCIG